jgi:hypothetical protein
MGFLFEFLVGFFAGRTAANTAQTARNTAEIAKLAAMTEAQKLAYQKRQTYLAGERRFVYIVFGVILAVVWIAGAFGG